MSADFFHSKFSDMYVKLSAMVRRFRNAQKLELAELEEIQEDLTVLYRLHSSDLSHARRTAQGQHVPFQGQINGDDEKKWRKKPANK